MDLTCIDTVLISHLPDDIKVYPLDITAQGIYTIGDIRREILEQEKKINLENKK